MTWTWTITFLLSLLFLLPIPGKVIKRYTNFGLVAGFLVGLVTLYSFVNIFNYWSFPFRDYLTIAGFPLLLALTWLPLEIFYAWTFTLDGHWALGALLGLPILSTLFHFFLLHQGLIGYNNWNLAYTFLYSILLHIIFRLYLTNIAREEL